MSDTTKTDGLLKPYAIITDELVGMLEKGVVPWRKPWRGAAPKSLATGKQYRGINTFVLACKGAMRGYASPYWVTFRQAIERGGHVRKGEQGTAVVFWKFDGKARSGQCAEAVDDEAEMSSTSRARPPMLRYYKVFNAASQCENLDVPATPEQAHAFEPIAGCEQVLQGMPRPPTIEHRGAQPLYSRAQDCVLMPARETFESVSHYYATLFHELAHSTGHASRLGRFNAADAEVRFGSPAYAREELVAEMGSAFLCGHCGIEKATLENAAAYIATWIARLKGNPRLAVVAAAQGQKAADWVLARADRGG